MIWKVRRCAGPLRPRRREAISPAKESCPASRSRSTASPSARSAVPVRRWKRYRLPRASSMTSRASDSLPSASTVWSSTPSGRRCSGAGRSSLVTSPPYDESSPLRKNAELVALRVRERRPARSVPEVGGASVQELLDGADDVPVHAVLDQLRLGNGVEVQGEDRVGRRVQQRPPATAVGGVVVDLRPERLCPPGGDPL